MAKIIAANPSTPSGTTHKPNWGSKIRRLFQALFIAFILVALGTAGAYLWMAQNHWNLEDTTAYIKSRFGMVVPPPVLFNANVGMERSTARETYANALSLLRDKRYSEAIEAFKQLESVYPGLGDLIAIHQAEAYAGLPNEMAAQNKLKPLTISSSHSPFQAKALYLLGQSHFRAKEEEEAHRRFSQLQDTYPNTEYASGADYYLGELAATKNRQATTGYWLRYLSNSPDGRFATNIAKNLDSLIEAPTPEQHRLIGLGYYNGKADWDKAIEHLETLPLQEVWLPLGRSLLHTDATQKGLQTLEKGLLYAKDIDEAREGLDLLVRNLSGSSSRITTLNRLNAQVLPYGKDYVLWRLAQFNPALQQSYYRQIITDYPESDYAPESAWVTLWPLIKHGKAQQFLKQSESYISRYAYSKAAPRILFWQAKLLEKQKAPITKTDEQGNELSTPPRQLAIKKYRQVLKDYPESYYAFRAFGRLGKLVYQKEDIGWRTLPKSEYPEVSVDINPLALMPKETRGQLAPKILEKAGELAAIGSTAANDLVSLLEESGVMVPAGIQSWQASANGQRDRAIRIIRDDLAETARKRKKKPTPPTNEELKLLYPVYFPENIKKQAGTNNIDPLLVQSLMREESYFNEFAVSTSNALGLMQLLPTTAKEVAGWVGRRSFKAPDLFIPEINIQLGSRYLGHLHQLFNGNSMLSVGSYNGGPNAMKRWVKASPHIKSDPDLFVENIPYEQTRKYIKKVYGSFWNYNRLYRTGAQEHTKTAEAG
ncbi:MAG: transglycosylase SLT domain-containing protein [Vampirovibrio sp.]|nr:transglycosylase SLT domain-containing protein [Vampirovibrio sp.]